MDFLALQTQIILERRYIQSLEYMLSQELELEQKFKQPEDVVGILKHQLKNCQRSLQKAENDMLEHFKIIVK